MRLVRAELAERAVTLPEVGAAAAPTTARSSIVLSVYDSDGRCGRGECAPLPGYSLDTLDACRDELNQFTAALAAPLWVSPEAAACWRAAAALSCAAARFAVESALLDLAGQATERSVAALFGAPRPSLALNRLVRSPADAAAALAAGVTTWKVKVGGEPTEPALLDALRALSPIATLRLDANRVFAVGDTRLATLGARHVEYIEEPYRSWHDAPAQTAIPLAADESLLTADHALWASLPSLGVRVVVCKPMALGWSGAWALAERAAAAGLDLVVTHLWDGPIGLAAAAQLALAVPGRLRACGLARHAGLALWPEFNVPFIGDAIVRSPTESGLGVR